VSGAEEGRQAVGLDDVFGRRARQLRSLQSKLLEIYDEAGYAEVIPPLVERPASLSSGAGRFLSDQTVIFSDPAGAGLLAIRPDMTPQIARIAATRLRGKKKLRLCYSGPVMLARPEHHSGSRQQWQTGIELMGVAGHKADAEIMHLAALSMKEAGFSSPVLQVGHLGLLRALVDGSGAPLEAWAEILMRRSPADMQQKLQQHSMHKDAKQALVDMAAGCADTTWLTARMTRHGGEFEACAHDLASLVDNVNQRLAGEVEIRIDAAAMPRFLYYSGIVFSGYAEGAAQALLHGGGYKAMMHSHGRDMSATGFSFDLFSWLDVHPAVS